jgi:hypothetical protein
MTEWQSEGVAARLGARLAPTSPEWTDPNPNAVMTGRRARDWGRVSAVLCEMTFTGGFEVDRSHLADRLVVILGEVGDCIHGRCASGVAAPAPDAPNRLYFVPARRCGPSPGSCASSGS